MPKDLFFVFIFVGPHTSNSSASRTFKRFCASDDVSGDNSWSRDNMLSVKQEQEQEQLAGARAPNLLLPTAPAPGLLVADLRNEAFTHEAGRNELRSMVVHSL